MWGRVLASPSLKGYFAGVQMERLIDHQTKFIAHVMGGPAEYAGRELAAVHHRLKIRNEDFDEVASILREVLEDAGMEAADVDAVIAIVASTRPHIVEA